MPDIPGMGFGCLQVFWICLGQMMLEFLTPVHYQHLILHRQLELKEQRDDH